MAMVQVAETLELRHTLARQILVDTLQRQLILITVIAGVVPMGVGATPAIRISPVVTPFMIRLPSLGATAGPRSEPTI